MLAAKSLVSARVSRIAVGKSKRKMNMKKLIGLGLAAARNIKVEVELMGASASMQAKYADAFRAHVTAQGELELINRRGAGLTFIIR